MKKQILVINAILEKNRNAKNGFFTQEILSITLPPAINIVTIRIKHKPQQ